MDFIDIIDESIGVAKRKSVGKKAASPKRKKDINKLKSKGIEIVNNPDSDAGLIDIRNIKTSKYIKNLDKKLEDWSGHSFAQYIKNKYYKKYSYTLNILNTGAAKEMSAIKDLLFDSFGRIDNILLKLYIDYFFKYHIDNIIRSGGFFNLTQLKRKNYINGFKAMMDKGNIAGEQLPVETYTSSESVYDSIINEETITKAFRDNSVESFSKFGLVIIINWLIMKNDCDLKAAMTLAAKACRFYYEKDGDINSIIKKSEQYGPYPMFFEFKDFDLFFNIINKKLNTNFFLNIDFIDINAYNFLRRDND